MYVLQSLYTHKAHCQFSTRANALGRPCCLTPTTKDMKQSDQNVKTCLMKQGNFLANSELSCCFIEVSLCGSMHSMNREKENCRPHRHSRELHSDVQRKTPYQSRGGGNSNSQPLTYNTAPENWQRRLPQARAQYTAAGPKPSKGFATEQTTTGSAVGSAISQAHEPAEVSGLSIIILSMHL